MTNYHWKFRVIVLTIIESLVRDQAGKIR